ncbi:MAG: NAD-dependent epimerase/dehydratase family protein [Candidatus Zambryskibacteria bacterium]|nr:NAD-dependent epimerase/dehydratase family protein [Candidatus Zambryskibacteria bacterium]
MKILITGVAGFIGSNFATQFRDKFPQAEIVGLDDLSSGRKDAVPKEVILYEGSIVDSVLLEKIFSAHKPEYVFHFAAIPRVSYSVQHPVETTHANVTGTVAILKTAKDHGVKRVILSSSSSVYGGAKILPTKESENAPDPKSPYAAQKFCDEIFAKVFSELYGLDTVCLRYFNVYGPGQYGDSAYSTVISAWLEALYFPEAKKAFIEGDGSQSRDFCYVDNVVLANILAMQNEKGFKGEVFNIAHSERKTVNEIKLMIEEYTGKEIELEKRPARAGDVAHTHADISKAKEWFGYEPKVNFATGLKKTVEWFEDRKKQ